MQEGEYFVPDPDNVDDKNKGAERRQDMSDAQAAFDPNVPMIPLPIAIGIGIVIGIIGAMLWHVH